MATLNNQMVTHSYTIARPLHGGKPWWVAPCASIWIHARAIKGAKLCPRSLTSLVGPLVSWQDESHRCTMGFFHVYNTRYTSVRHIITMNRYIVYTCMYIYIYTYTSTVVPTGKYMNIQKCWISRKTLWSVGEHLLNINNMVPSCVYVYVYNYMIYDNVSIYIYIYI